MSLKNLLTAYADEHMPLDNEWPDCREYAESVNPFAIDGDKWLEARTSYIWKVGVLAQWDSNKCDYAYIVIGYEREPGQMQVLGHLYFPQGENDDIGRVLGRAIDVAASIHPVFIAD